MRQRKLVSVVSCIAFKWYSSGMQIAKFGLLAEQMIE
jgi:hypothetical protein